MLAIRGAAARRDGHRRPCLHAEARPNKDLVDALRALGAELDSTNDGYLPHACTAARALNGPVKVPARSPASTSRACSRSRRCSTDGLTIEVEGDLTSKPYIDLTLDEMAKFGVNVDNRGYQRAARRRSKYRGGRPSTSKAMPLPPPISRRWLRCTAASISSRISAPHPPGRLRVFRSLREAGRDGAARVRQHRHRRAARRLEPAASIAAGGHEQHAGRRADLDDDCAVPRHAHAHRGPSTLRVKECDRIAAPTRELRKLGVSVEEGPDFMVIEPLSAAAKSRRDSRRHRDLSRPPHRDVASECWAPCSRACASSILAA